MKKMEIIRKLGLTKKKRVAFRICSSIIASSCSSFSLFSSISSVQIAPNLTPRAPSSLQPSRLLRKATHTTAIWRSVPSSRTYNTINLTASRGATSARMWTGRGYLRTQIILNGIAISSSGQFDKCLQSAILNLYFGVKLVGWDVHSDLDFFWIVCTPRPGLFFGRGYSPDQNF